MEHAILRHRKPPGQPLFPTMSTVGLILTLSGAYLSFEILFRLLSLVRAVRGKSLYVMAGYTEMITNNPVFDPLLGTVGKDSEVGLFKENRTVSFWWFEKYGRIVHENHFRLNNVGLFSQHDYPLERKADEYRIVVLGDEMTASTTADVSWPDWLEEELNEDPEASARIGRTVRVFNLGWPDAGFGHIAQVWREKAKRFDPDLVLVNVVEHDFQRTLGGSDRRFQGKEYRGIPLCYRASTGEEALLVGLASGDAGSLRSPLCTAGRPFALFLPRALAKDPEKLWEVQRRIVRDYVTGVAWRALATPRPVGLLFLLGHEFDPLSARRIEAPPASPVADAEMVEHARAGLRSVLDDHPNVLLVRNVWHSQVFPEPAEFRLIRLLEEADPAIRIVDMRNYLPFEKGEAEVRSWYQIPLAGEKWSNKGHRAYAKAVARVVKEHLAGGDVYRRFDETPEASPDKATVVAGSRA